MINLYFGTVGSGKSLHLISSYLNELRRRPENEVALVKPLVDNRTSGIYTRFGNQEIEPTHVFGSSRLEWLHLLEKKKYVFIDEIQFFPPEALMDIYQARKPGNEYHLYGLRNDFLGSMWPSMKCAFNLADTIHEVSTFCDMCKERKASFNKKVGTCKHATDPGFHYIPVCWECFKTPQKQS